MLGRGRAGAEGQDFRPPVAMETSMTTNGGAAGLTFEVGLWCGALLWSREGLGGQRTD